MGCGLRELTCGGAAALEPGTFADMLCQTEIVSSGAANMWKLAGSAGASESRLGGPLAEPNRSSQPSSTSPIDLLCGAVSIVKWPQSVLALGWDAVIAPNLCNTKQIMTLPSRALETTLQTTDIGTNV